MDKQLKTLNSYKSLFYLGLFFIFSILPFSLFSSFENAGDIIIEIEGLRNSKGTILLGLYNKKEKFPKDGGSLVNLSGKIVNGICKLEAKALPHGDYALALLHDENNNGKMDYNWLGIPNEGFGFSRNPSLGLTAPSFNETKITIDGLQKRISIKVKYM